MTGIDDRQRAPVLDDIPVDIRVFDPVHAVGYGEMQHGYRSRSSGKTCSP
jgi:hypothetical protein